MPQYNVPQFVEIEDKIIGPFTLRQFLVILAGGIFIVVFWSIFEFGLFFWILSAPTALVSFGISLGNFNGRPVLSHVLPLISFIKQPKRLVYHKGVDSDDIIKTVQPQQEAKEPVDVQTRLKRLAYVLDQKMTEEEALYGKSEIHSPPDGGSRN